MDPDLLQLQSGAFGNLSKLARKLTLTAHLIILSNDNLRDQLISAARAADASMDITFCSTAEELERSISSYSDTATLISLGTSVIVSKSGIDALNGRAFNIHPASPAFPGRDPHHFAHYMGAKVYGATLHHMTDKVDAGAIIDVAEFDTHQLGPKDLMHAAERSAIELFAEWVGKLIKGQIVPKQNWTWGSFKTTRSDFQSLCRVSPLDSKVELERRFAATFVEGHNNLKYMQHGFVFTAVEACEAEKKENPRWREFTPQGYRALLDQAMAKGLNFAGYETERGDPNIIWRHDVDHSIPAALLSARMEGALGIKATYFFATRLPYYNIMLRETLDAIEEIASLGHTIGLHFNSPDPSGPNFVAASLDVEVKSELDLFETLVGIRPKVVSYHDPMARDMLLHRSLFVGGALNAYATEFSPEGGYVYASDSNGYWRHQAIKDSLEVPAKSGYHILTHPEWWMGPSGSPRERISYWILNEARSLMAEYDDHLARSGRSNLQF